MSLQSPEIIERHVVDELNEIGLSTMASALDQLYHQADFMRLDRLAIVEQIVSAEYSEKKTKGWNNRLTRARLKGSPASIEECVDSTERSYIPTGITDLLQSLDFVESGLNICILGPSDSGKTYLAKAIGIFACKDYRVRYTHCEDLLSELNYSRQEDYSRYQKKLRSLIKLDLLIIDDFLLHTITDESEIKILHDLMEKRTEMTRSTIVCSQRDPKSWSSMIMNDEVSADAICKRVTKHYTIMITPTT